jgi:signal transduction histidine kinase
VTALAAHSLVERNVTPGLLRGDPAAVARLDRVVRGSVVDGRTVRVKIWRDDGRILYSDDHRLIGSRYPLGADELTTIRQGKVAAEVSDLTRPENRFERRYGKLLEVYLPIRDRGGRKFLFEAYQHFSSVTASARSIWVAFLPALLIAVGVLYLLQLPIAASMARRLRRGSREREKLLERAVDASSTERRRIAADLHDGVVQDLAGLSFNLAAASERSKGAEQARQGVRGLRSLLVEIYPPSLRQAGLASALADLLGPVASRGIETELEVAEDLQLPAETEALFFRVAQEAVRNAVAHGSPHRIGVTVIGREDEVVLEVADDGTGFRPDSEESAGEGHFGLSMLRDLAREAGAGFEVESAPGAGTRVRVEVMRG